MSGSNPKPPTIPGTKPHDWEASIGGTLERTVAMGRDAMQFVERHPGMDMPKNDRWRGIQSLGKESLAMRSDKSRKDRGKAAKVTKSSLLDSSNDEDKAADFDSGSVYFGLFLYSHLIICFILR